MVKNFTQISNAEIGIAACRFDLKGSAPTEIQLVPYGVFNAKDGRPHGLSGWRMFSHNAPQVIDYAKSLSDDLVIDYEHQTLFSETNGQPAPAAGWFKTLQWREGEGLYATDVQWTEAAKAAIEAREYRYISPVITYNKETGDVQGIQMAALVNYAAIDGLSDLTARAAAHFSFSKFNQNEDSPVNKKLLKLLGLAEDATEEDVQKAVAALKAQADAAEQLQTDVAALKAAAEKPDPEKYVPVAVAEDMKTEIADLKSKVHGREVNELIESGLDDGRLIPAQKAWAEELGKKDIAALKGYLDSAQPIAALKGSQTNGQEPEGTESEHGLNETETAVCKALGVSPEEYSHTKKAGE